MERMERDHFRLSRTPPQAHLHPPHYRRNAPENILPSIGCVLGDIYHSTDQPMPPGPHTSYHPSNYSPKSPIRSPAPPAPPALTRFVRSSEEPWTPHKQGQKHPLPPTTYPRPSDYPVHSSSPNEFSEYLRPHSSFSINGHGIGNRNRLGPVPLAQMSPTSESTYISYQDSISNVNDSEANTEMCSDVGESEFTSGVCDTHSQAGSSVSQMYLRQFTCKTCRTSFKCESLLR